MTYVTTSKVMLFLSRSPLFVAQVGEHSGNTAGERSRSRRRRCEADG